MENRETKVLTTPSGKEVIMKMYLNGREERSIRMTLFNAAEIDISKIGKKRLDRQAGEIKDEEALTGFDLGKQQIDEEEALIAAAVVSYNGSAEDVISRLLDAPVGDYDFVYAAAKDIRKNPILPKTPGAGASSSAGEGAT